MKDVIIVGGGPAGLNAALVLGRVRREVLLADAGRPRNAPAAHTHGMLSRDGADPSELRRIGREQLAAFPSVTVRDVMVRSVTAGQGDNGDGFAVEFGDGTIEQARRVLLAMGVTDDVPPIEGVAALWGRGVFHCAYCHGWEVRDRPVAVLGGSDANDRDANDKAAHLAVHLTRLGCDVVLCAGGPLTAPDEVWEALRIGGVYVDEEPVTRIEQAGEHQQDSSGSRTVRVVYASGRTLDRDAAFAHSVLRQGSDLAARLGCTLLDDEAIQVDELGHTTLPGVHAAGDLCRTPVSPSPFPQVVIAAAEGARAAMVIDQELLRTGASTPRDATAQAPGPKGTRA